MATIKIKSFKFHKDSLTEMRAQDPALAKIAAAAMSARENEINTVHTINLLCWGGPMHGQCLELEDNCTDSQSLAFEMRGMVGSYKRAVDTSKRNYGGRPELDNYLSWCGSGMQARKPEPHEMAPVTRDSTTKATGSSKGFELFGELLGQIDSDEAPVEVVKATETKSHEPICTGVDDFGTEFHIVTRAQELQSLGRVDVWSEVTGRGKKQVIKHRADFHQVGGWFMDDFGNAIRCTLATLTPAVAFCWRVDASFELVTFQVARTRYKVRNTPEKRNSFREKLMKNRKSFADKLLNPAKPADVVPAAPVEAVVVPVVPAAPVEAVVVAEVAPTEAPEVAPASQEPAPVPAQADEVPQAPKLKHGKNWAGQDLTGWTYGEKLDGCRAFWDGARFWGKDGQPLHLPEVAATMPAGVVLDGEIWAGRGNFEAARLYVQYGTPSDLVRFVAFDAPAAKGTWAQRLATVPDTVERVKVCTVRSMTELAQDVADMMDDGAEGIMCHAPQVSAYRGGRDATLVKVKAHTFCHFEAFFDQVAEAVAPTEAPTEAATEAPEVVPEVAPTEAPEVAPASQEPAPVPTVADEVPQVLAPVVPAVPALHQKARAKSGAWEAQLWQAGGLCWLAFWVLGAAVPVLSSYATRRDVLAALQRLALGLLAPTEAPTVAPLAALDLVEHTTARGKVLRGVVRADLTKEQAQALDAYTFRKDGGWFIRERHLPEAAPVATVPTVADKVAQVLAQAQAAATDGTDSQGDERAALLAQFAHLEQGQGTATASRNIKRQLKRTWPGVVFGVRKDSAAAVRVTWADGPSEAQVNALVGRFCEGSFDGMKECYEYRSDVFNDLFGGCCYLFTRRDVGDELAQRAIERAFEGWTALPTVEDWRASRGLFDWRNDGQVWARRVRDALEELDGVAELA